MTDPRRPVTSCSRVRVRCTGIVVTLLVLLASAACTSASPAPVTRSVPTGSLHVTGNLLESSTGARVLLTGVTDYLLPFYTQGGSADPMLAAAVAHDFARRDADFAAMRQRHYNTVRVPLGADVFYNDVYAQGGETTYLNQLKAVVASAHRAGLYVVFSWWGLFDGSSEQGANLATAMRMMRTVATTFAADRAVLYEPVNEPHNMDWSQWRDQMGALLSWWRTTIRYSGPLILDTINYSWDFDPASAQAMQDLDARLRHGSSQVLFGNHRYANSSTCFCGAELTSWLDGVGQYVDAFPIVGTEYGWFNNMGPPQPNWNIGLLDYLSVHSVPDGLNGALAFVWHWVDGNSMTTAASVPNDLTQTYDQRFVTPSLSRVPVDR